MIWIYTLLSVLIVSAVSLVGIFTFSIDQKKLGRILIYLVSFSAGTLLGDAFIHLIPETFKENKSSTLFSVCILAGILVFFVIEKFLHWRHCHKVACDDHPHPFSYVLLVGDAVHNLIDGMVIAASYLVSIPVGIATTIAVVFHEIPQEIGDFGSLLYAGFKKTKALFFNFLTALTAVLGAIFVLALNINGGLLVPFAAGGFIYIASSDLIPELHKDTGHGRSFWQLVSFILGIGTMLGLLLFD